MVDKSEKKSAKSLDRTGEFFNVGAPLHAVKPSYVRRPADDLLFDTIVSGDYAHVIAPDRSGKTSLIASTAARLKNNDFKVAVIDLAQIAERDGGSEAGRWYYSIAYRLLRQLRLKTDLQGWWQDHSILSHRQRLVEFYVQVVLKNVSERIVVFVDEVQLISDLPFEEHLLVSIRAAFNARTTEPEFGRLCFVTLGSCDPGSLVGDPHLSPFPVSTEIRLDDFSREDLAVFATELNLSPDDAEVALDRIYYWTAGQPYLSQKLGRAIARESIQSDVEANVDRLVQQQLAGRAAISSEPHLSHLHHSVIGDEKNHEALLTLYGKIRKGITIECDPELPLHRRILAIGLVVVDERGEFAIRNRIYEAVFTARWANENLPLHWRGLAIAALLIVALTAIPFSYTQLLPKPYLQVMANSTYDLETVSDAYQNLRSFPGHVTAADRMFQSVIENRARQASDRSQIRELAGYATLLPDGVALGNNIAASFWDRQAELALREERRDDALLAAIEALTVTSQQRRRRAASIVGDDFSQLIATIQSPDADGMVFNSDNVQLSWYQGAEVRQWSYAGGNIQAHEPWIMSALEVTPLVRRVIVDRAGSASRLGLTINVSHQRLDDLRVKLIAPSGRATDLTFTQASSAANEEIRVPQAQLAPLLGESLSGTWSLSLRDEATGVSGHLVSWNLSLNSQVVVESFDRGLDIPDPVERPSENPWFAPDGRYAIARALQSDSARLWDLNYARAARTIAVPASEKVIGLSMNAKYLVTLAQTSVNLWRTSDGRRESSLEVGTAISDTMLSADGEHLLVSYRTDTDTYFEVWSLESGEIIAEMSVAGVPALVSIDASAVRLATADFDRAVRIWNLRDGEIRAQIDLDSQPSEIQLSPNGEFLGVLQNQQSVSLWRMDRVDAPVIEETGDDEWHMAFSPSGARFLAGNQREGLQVFESADGTPSGPLLDPGLTAGSDKIFRFGGDESVVMTAGLTEFARFWAMPATSNDSNTAPSAESAASRKPSTADFVVSAIAPGGERVAFGDRSGHVHIQQVEMAVQDVDADSDEISFLGHRDAVLSMVFSDDGALIASAGADGSIRVWDAHSGLPRPFYGRSSVPAIDRIMFSPSASQLAVLGGQRVWLMDTETGAELANVDLGEAHSDLAFLADGQLFLGGSSGALRNFYADRTGNWHLRNVWSGSEPIRNLDIAPTRQQIVLVDGRNQARLLDPRNGRIGSDVLSLPDKVDEVEFSPNESRVLFKTGRWIHRAIVAPTGLIWTDTVRAPKSMHGSRMAFNKGNEGPPDVTRAADQSGGTVLILATETGLPELAEIRFSYSDGPALFGSKAELLREWSEKLHGSAVNAFVREGF